MFRFLHTSDLHLGKRFGHLPEELRGRLTEARFRQIGNLAGRARSEGASHIVIAGDLFDAQTPSPQTRRQALRAMAGETGVDWVVLPGNHDSLVADELWSAMRRDCPDNVVLALEPKLLRLSAEACLLPAPCTTRQPGRDLTAWMDTAATPEDACRIGLAHGAVRDFGEEGATDIITPDRAHRARLDYLALGDWHGRIAINERSWYSGTPEPDRIKHEAPGSALLVSLAAPGALPEVRTIETGSFAWLSRRLSLLPGENVRARLDELLPAAAVRRDTLLCVDCDGCLRPAEHASLRHGLEDVKPDFALLEWRDARLSIEYEVTDLDDIDKGGVLRQAADTLLQQASDDALSAGEREIARKALNRLYAYATEAA